MSQGSPVQVRSGPKSLFFTFFFFFFKIEDLEISKSFIWIVPNSAQGILFGYTVKPALSDHPTVQEKVVVIDRWSLKQGSLNSGQFFEALLNIGERRGTHAYDLRNDKSRRPGTPVPREVVFSQTCAVVVVFKENLGSKQRFFLLLVA